MHLVMGVDIRPDFQTAVDLRRRVHRQRIFIRVCTAQHAILVAITQ